MKYILYLAGILILFSIIAGYFSIPASPVQDDVVLSINKRNITREEFNRRLAATYNSDRQEFISSLVTRELMIQEAQRQGIDKDEAFRKSIQDYYEQSLIKQVMDKKLNSLNVGVTDAEIDRYAAFQNSTVHLTIFRALNADDAEKSRFKTTESKIIPVRNLAGDIAERLETFKAGEMTPPLCDDSECLIFRLDKVVVQKTPLLGKEERLRIGNSLIERKKQKNLDAWVNSLKSKSDIKIQIR